jgi:cytochrome c oxidase subunit IV
MAARLRQLTLGFGALFLLLAFEIWISFQPFDRALRPLILVPAALMCGLIARIFMELDRGRELVCLFSIATLLWLAILLGLGALDPLTRVNYGEGVRLQNAESNALIRLHGSIGSAPS